MHLSDSEEMKAIALRNAECALASQNQKVGSQVF